LIQVDLFTDKGLPHFFVPPIHSSLCNTSCRTSSVITEEEKQALPLHEILPIAWTGIMTI
jgi:hypothetical protein